MHRGLIGLIAGTALGLAAAAPAQATSPPLASTASATSLSADSADLNGVVYRDAAGAQWRFEYSTDPGFGSVMWTPPVSMSGHLTAVERMISGLAASTTYYWRVVLFTHTASTSTVTFGHTAQLQTEATPTPQPAPSTAPVQP